MKKGKLFFFGFICGIIISMTISVYALIKYDSNSIGFKPKNSNWQVNNLEDAINDLYLRSGSNSGTAEINQVWSYDFENKINIFIIPASGKYLLETWGAQGGDARSYSKDVIFRGGYGAYSKGEIYLESGDFLFISVGQMGQTLNGGNNPTYSAFNGGGIGFGSDGLGNISDSIGGGGGTTHIAREYGLLKDLKNTSEDIIIVAGAGGGAVYYNNSDRYVSTGQGGDGGGYIGNSSTKVKRIVNGSEVNVSTQYGIGGSENNKNYFGYGATATSNTAGIAGAGAGYFGGYIGNYGSGGGSGYIGNEDLINKVMYCFECKESSNDNTKTVSTTNVSESPISNYAKIGNGYAKITYLGN